MRSHPRGETLFLPYQIRWVEDETPVKIMVKSRRIGITWATGLHLLVQAAEGKGDVTYVAYDEDIALEFIREMGEWARKFQYLAEGDAFYKDDKDLMASSLRLSSGCRITALASTPRKFRGRKGTVIIDEAAMHKDLGEVIQAALAVKTWGGQTIIISTHKGYENEFNNLVQKVKAGSLSYSLHEVTLDDALADGFFKRVCYIKGEKWSPEYEQQWREEAIAEYPDAAAADEELFCIPRSGGDSYFEREVVTRCMDESLPVLYLRPDSEWEQQLLNGDFTRLDDWLHTRTRPLLEKLDKYNSHYLGMDFARSGHLTVIAPLSIDANGHRAIPFMVEMGRVPHEAQRRILWDILDRLPRFSGARLDAGGNGSWLAEVTNAQYPMAMATTITQTWYVEQVPKLLRTIQSGEIRLPFSRELQSDFDLFRFHNGVPRIPHRATQRGVRGQIRHGDGAMAVVLAHHASAEHDDLGEYLDNLCTTRWL